MKECPACKRCFADDIVHCPEDGEATAPSLLGDSVLDGRYQLESRLGQGGMGVVYRARHIFLKTAHAIKVILPDLVGNDPNLATRFRQEAMAAANVRHPNIIAVTDFGIVRGNMPFLVMEFVQGESLHDILQREKCLAPARALEWMSAIGAGVAAAHRQNIVHRDLKPLNVMLQDGLPINEGVRILDFGLAKIKSGEILGSFVAAQTSGLMGSPFYMAPEQWSDEEPDARADIYSLGVMMYQMLVGEVPFKGASIPSIMRKHLTEAPAPMVSFGFEIPVLVESAVRHALEKDPASRPATVEAFLTELRTAVIGTADLNRPAIDIGQVTNPDLTPNTGDFDPQQTQISSANLGSMSGGASSPHLDEASFRQIPEAIEAQKLRDQAAILEARARQSAEIQRLELDSKAKLEGVGSRSQEVSSSLPPVPVIDAGVISASTPSSPAIEEVPPVSAPSAPLASGEVSLPAPASQLPTGEVSASLPTAPIASGRVSIPPTPVPLSDGELVNFGSTDPGREPVNTQAIGEAAVVGSVSAPVVSIPPPVPVVKSSPLKTIFAVAGAILLLAVGAGGYGLYRYATRGSRHNNRVQTPGPTPSPTPSPVVEAPPRQYTPNLTAIPGGKFTMGNNDRPQDSPAHNETVAPFSMDITEVTNGEYAQFIRETGYESPAHFHDGKPKAGEEDFPIGFVDAADAEAFAAWRSKRDGVTYRLPTEIEWEYAARSGSKNYTYPWGNDWDPSRALTKAGGATTLTKVGSFPSGQNIWGVQDLVGSVREWTSSKVTFYPGNDQITPEQIKEVLDKSVNDRVVRGSSYYAPIKFDVELTATFRDWFPVTDRRDSIGFRLVKSGN